MSFISIAERKLILIDKKTGEKKDVNVRIGQPFWKEIGTYAACPVEIDGVYGRIPDICSDDLLGSLEAAICLVDKMLTDLTDEERLLYPSGEDYKSHFDILLKDKIK